MNDKPVTVTMLAVYISQAYVILIGILMTPLYISYMGSNAYGLVGFFAMLQFLFNFLDMGLTATVTRETARFHGGKITALQYRCLIRALEVVFFALACFGGVLLFMLATPISLQWLNANGLDHTEVLLSLQLMAFIVCVRWLSGLYRGVVTGSEKLLWLSAFNAIISTMRFGLVILVLIFISSSPVIFFKYQVGVALIEFVFLLWITYANLPVLPVKQKLGLSLSPLKPVLKFSSTLAFTSSVWVLVTQTDKIILSKILSLSDYGYFTAAVLVASGIMMISAPASSLIMPKMSRLYAANDINGVIKVYRQYTRLVTAISVPVVLIFALMPEKILWAWTGDRDLVDVVSDVLSLYAVGYGFLVLGAFPYYLQYAIGNLRLHLLGNILFSITLVPIMILAVVNFGMSGAGWVWLVLNVVYFLVWIPYIHKCLAPGLHKNWIIFDIGVTAIFPICIGVIAIYLVPWSQNRIVLSTEIGLFCVLMFAFSILSLRFFESKFVK